MGPSQSSRGWLRGLRSSSTEVVAVTLRTLISSDGGSEEGEAAPSRNQHGLGLGLGILLLIKAWFFRGLSRP